MLKRLLLKVYSFLTKDSKFYPKGMNTLVDPSIPELVEIGDGFISAPGSIILAHDASTITHSGKSRIEKTIIGENVFLGANAVILPGIIIGDGCIIGAGAIVTKDIPALSVAVGNPARVLCTVDEYMKKCEKRNVLYNVTESVSVKHGKGIKYTKEEGIELQKSIYTQYQKRNSVVK